MRKGQFKSKLDKKGKGILKNWVKEGRDVNRIMDWLYHNYGVTFRGAYWLVEKAAKELGVDRSNKR